MQRTAMQAIGFVLLSTVFCGAVSHRSWTTVANSARTANTLQMTTAPDSITILQSDTSAIVDLGSTPARVVLRSVRGSDARDVLASRLRTLAPGRRLYLVVADLRADQTPGTLFDLYIDADPSVTLRRDAPQYVGSVNFYAATRAHDERPVGAVAPAYSFDITDLARTLAARGALGGTTVVTIAPVRTPAAESRATIGRIAIVEQ